MRQICDFLSGSRAIDLFCIGASRATRQEPSSGARRLPAAGMGVAKNVGWLAAAIILLSWPALYGDISTRPQAEMENGDSGEAPIGGSGVRLLGSRLTKCRYW